jgi:LacI family transcriptional regulator
MIDSSGNNKKLRIKDIAELAEVSEGTVDRVIHGRGHVAEEKQAKIEGIIEQLKYKPNLVARSLALKKNLRFVAFIPAFEEGGYWSYIQSGLEKARKEMVNYKVMVDYVYFNQYEKDSFLSAATRIVDMAPSAVIFAPVFIEDSINFARKLEKKKIPYVLIDSNLEDVRSLTYYGQHSYKSGYLVAKLLFDGLPQGSTILLTHSLRKSIQGSNQAVNRERGFMSYVEERGIKDKYKLIRLDLHSDNKEESLKNLQQITRTNPDISGAVIFSSRVHRLLRILEAMKIDGVKVIGYDELPPNVKALKEGVVSFLIAQRPEMQGYLSVKDLCKDLLFKQKVHRVNYIPIDILTKETVDEYVKFNHRLNE